MHWTDFVISAVLGVMIGCGVSFTVRSLWPAYRVLKKRPSSSLSPSPSSFPNPGKNPISPSLTSQIQNLYQLSTHFFSATTYAYVQSVRDNTQLPTTQTVKYGYGYRAWRIEEAEPNSFELTPLVNYAPYWRPGVNQSICWNAATKHKSPAEGCRCGFWCFHKLENVRRPWTSVPPTSWNSWTATGSILGLGKAIRHTDGWRFEKAIVVAILEPDPPEPRAGVTQLYEKYVSRLLLLAMRYDVPLVPKGEFVSFTENAVKSMYEKYEPHN